MRWVITGAGGFVGHNLRNACERRGIAVVPLHRGDADLCSLEQTMEAFRHAGPAAVIVHLASYRTAGAFTAAHPATLLRLNVQMGMNVLEAWRRILPGARLIVVGASCAYPGEQQHLREELFLRGEVHPSVGAYGVGKRFLYIALQSYCAEFGLRGTYVVPATMFGPHDDFVSERAHVVGALLGRFMRAVREHTGPVTVWGSGRQVRDVLYVKDFTDMLIGVAPHLRHDILNIGPGDGITIRHLTDAIVAATGYTGEVVFDPQQYEGVSVKSINADRLHRAYGLRTRWTLAAALEETVEWLRDHPAALDPTCPPVA
jgi:GDP-L-fucose synthase